MAKYRQIVSFVSETPWAMLPSKLAQICDLIEFKADNGVLTVDEVEERVAVESYAAKGRSTAKKAGAVAVIPVYGVVSPKTDIMSAMSGGTGMDQFTAAVNQAANDPNVASIVLDLDTPGGAVPGVPEAAMAIRSARSKKPVVAMVNNMAASAGYWLAAQASEIVVSPSGEVGSVGVYAAHTDVSGAMDQEGVKTTLISAGKYKTELSPFAPLSEEGRQAIQSNVDVYYQMFTADIAKGRGVDVAAVRSGFGEGRMVTAKDAVKAGMADRVDTFESTVNRMLSSVTSHSNSRRAEVEEGQMLALPAGTSSASDLNMLYTVTRSDNTTNDYSSWYVNQFNTSSSGSNVEVDLEPVEIDEPSEVEEADVSETDSLDETTSDKDDTIASSDEGPQKTLADLRKHSKESAINERRNYLDLLERMNQ